MKQDTTKEQLVIITKEQQIFCVPGDKMREIDVDTVEELKNSILEVGMLNPITIRTVNDNCFQVVCGAHRWAAMCAILNSTDASISCPAKMIECEDQNVLELQIRENLQRKDLTPSERVTLGDKLKELYNIRIGPAIKGQEPKKTAAELAADLGVPLRTYQRMQYVVKHGEPWLVQAMDNKEINPGDAEKIIKSAKATGVTQKEYHDLANEANDEANASTGNEVVDESLPDFLQPVDAKAQNKAKREFKKSLSLLQGDLLNLYDLKIEGEFYVKMIQNLLKEALKLAGEKA